MKRILISLVLLVAFSFQAEAQKPTKQYAGTVKYQKTEQEATIFEVPYPANQVEEGLKDLASKQGVKVREKNGFYEARNLVLKNLDHKKHDVYYRVDKNGRNESKVYIILTEPGEDLINRTSSHAALAGSAAGGAVILASIAPHLDEHDYNMVKLQQENEIKQAEKKLASLQDEQGNIEKKISSLNKDLEKNRSEQGKAVNELEVKRSALTEFEQKREQGKKKKL